MRCVSCRRFALLRAPTCAELSSTSSKTLLRIRPPPRPSPPDSQPAIRLPAPPRTKPAPNTPRRRATSGTTTALTAQPRAAVLSPLCKSIAHSNRQPICKFVACFIVAVCKSSARSAYFLLQMRGLPYQPTLRIQRPPPSVRFADSIPALLSHLRQHRP
jgi:hypothetical protein